MATMPSGSFMAAGFLLYDATLSSGYFKQNVRTHILWMEKMRMNTLGDQSRSVIDRFFPFRSSKNSQTRLTRPSESSLRKKRIKDSVTMYTTMDVHASLCANSIVANVVIPIVECPLHNFGRLFNKIQEFWCSQDASSLFLG
jgi:hypothetical protein